MGIYLSGVKALADLAIANYRMGLMDKDGIVILDEKREFSAVVPLDSIDNLLIKEDYGYAIYSIESSLTAGHAIALKALGKFSAVHTDHQLLDAIGISLEDDTYRSAMCDDAKCCPIEGNKTSDDKSGYLLVSKEYENKQDTFDNFMAKLEFGSFDDSLIKNLDVRDAVLTELTSKNRWQLILDSEPPMDYDTDEFKTFYALALVFTSRGAENAVEREFLAASLLEDVVNYSLAGLVKQAIQFNSWEGVVKAFTQFEVSHLLSHR